ncbi:MAG: RrF2 family transcriptional regulator [Bacillota bacterium]|jgi:Rrf2 family cysteine metabolism transcriptional repressor|nr:Rrf2 family transcriptional regulator [Candidatus Fermentithermobacillaceae bacterium]
MPFRLSTRGHYAVLIMYELARSGESFSSLQDISASQRLSQRYLEQIVRPLRQAGLVQGKRGFGGGYVLAREASAITVGEIVRAVEGPVVPVECVADGSTPERCPDDCKAKSVWQKVGEAIDNVLDSITLEDLVRDDIEQPASSKGGQFCDK